MTRRGLFRLLRGAAAVPAAAVAAVVAQDDVWPRANPHTSMLRWVWEPGMMVGNWREVAAAQWPFDYGGFRYCRLPLVPYKLLDVAFGQGEQQMTPLAVDQITSLREGDFPR